MKTIAQRLRILFCARNGHIPLHCEWTGQVTCANRDCGSYLGASLRFEYDSPRC